MIPIILSGGSGTRLWPLSRKLYPKQFFPLYSDKTLFQDTILRVKSFEENLPIIICNEEYRFIVAENIQNIGCKARNIVLEPTGRNTAPAIACAALIAIKDSNNDNDPVLMVLPADHIIKDISAFADAALNAKKLAEKGHMVTFGIKPTYAHTGYGYIELGKSIEKNANEISQFKEKPDKETAEKFIKSGKYLWNSGMFCFKASIYLAELKKYQPKLLEYAKNAVENSKTDLDFDRLEKQSFEQCPNIAIDYAVMEKTKLGVVVSLDAGWSDIGSWDSLWESLEKDENNNAHKGDVIIKNCKDSYIYSENKLIASIGVKDLIIVDTQDALLVANKDNAQDVKIIAEQLKQEKRDELLQHKTIYRPWGHYSCISSGERHQTKRISVKPNAKLSLQKHMHRSEHWVVVRGVAKVTKGDETFILSENESVYIPIGVVHALENPGKIDLEIIEIQTGSYLGEDDIIRLEDIYGRTNM